MNELIVNIDSAAKSNKKNLLNKLLQLFVSDGAMENKVQTFMKWLSDCYYPQLCVFVSTVSPKLMEEFPSQVHVYGTATEDISAVHPLLPLLEKLGALNEGAISGMVEDLSDTELKKAFTAQGILSYFIIPLVIKQNKLGYLALLENEVTRLWSVEEQQEILDLSKVYGQYLYAETLEKELFYKEDVIQKAIESSNDGYWHIDLVQNQMHFSRQWKRMLGFSESELQDSFETFENLLHPDDKDLVLQVLDPYLKIGVGSYECEYRIRNKEGKYLWVLTRANINFSDNGIPLQFVATNTDITSRIEYKKQLALSEAKFKRLIGSIHEIIFEIDNTGMITFLNEAWERHLLLKVKKTIGTEATKYIHPEDRAIGRKILGLPYAGKDLVHKTQELRLLAANGKSVWVEIHVSIIYNEQHKIEEIKGTLVNIDERKKVEIAQKASENRSSRISENISDIIVELDENGKYLFISNAVRSVMGRNTDEFIGKVALFDVHPLERKRVNENLFDQLLNGAGRVVEQFRVKSAIGAYIWVEAIVQPLISASGKRTFIGVLRDISARRKVEDEMKSALNKEKELNELKSRFITMTSHEFRTPLSAIRSSVELLEMYADDLGERFMKPFEKHFRKITNQVSRIANLLNNIDTLGRIESSEMPFHPEKQNLVGFVNNLINEQLAEKFKNRTISLRTIGIPKTVVYDPNLFITLLTNILDNALIYSHEGPIECEIFFGDEEFEIMVKDSGLGVPSDELSLIFNSFFRAKNIVNLNIPGNGLGLRIAQKIVDLHKGYIKVESIENEETKVFVRIPNLSL